MGWFTAWWEGLSALQQIFACAAIPATILLVLQTLLLLFGLGGHSADQGETIDHSALPGHGTEGEMGLDSADHDHDAAHHGDGVRLFTIRGLVAFFAVGGWLGIALADTQINTALTIVIAVAGGFAALVFVALIIKWSLNLQENGTLSLQNTIGRQASVYITIPPDLSGTGKVMVTVQDQLRELEAMTDSRQPLATGSQVKITGVIQGGILQVQPLVLCEKEKIDIHT